MVWQKFCLAMLAGAVASMLALPLRADDLKKEDPKNDPKEQVPPPKGADGGCCDQQYHTVRCYEWVPETHMVKKTCYKHECREETCTVYKTECVPETRTRCVTCRKLVPECHEETCCVRVCVPHTEQRTCYEHRVTCKEVCSVERRCVDRGHWECCEELSLIGRLQERMDRSRRHHGDCCDSCGGCGNSCCDTGCRHYQTRTVRHWVSCKVWEEVPCKKMVRCCECVPVTKCVTCYTYETRQEVRKRTCYKCVCETHNETYTCMVPHCVACQVTRKVNVCVPYCVEVPVTCCVRRCVEKRVPCCQTSCCQPSCGSCGSDCCEQGGLRRLFRGLQSRGCGCGDSCGGCHSGCHSGCGYHGGHCCN